MKKIFYLLKKYFVFQTKYFNKKIKFCFFRGSYNLPRINDEQNNGRQDQEKINNKSLTTITCEGNYGSESKC